VPLELVRSSQSISRREIQKAKDRLKSLHASQKAPDTNPNSFEKMTTYDKTGDRSTDDLLVVKQPSGLAPRRKSKTRRASRRIDLSHDMEQLMD